MMHVHDKALLGFLALLIIAVMAPMSLCVVDDHSRRGCIQEMAKTLDDIEAAVEVCE